MPRARKTLTARFTDFFTDFEKKTTVLQSNCFEFSLTTFQPCSMAQWLMAVSLMSDWIGWADV